MFTWSISIRNSQDFSMQTTSGRQCEGAESYLWFLQLFVGHEEVFNDDN